MLDKMSNLGVVLNKESQKSINGGGILACRLFCGGSCTIHGVCLQYEK